MSGAKERLRRVCPACRKLARMDRHYKPCFTCGRQRCVDHPKAVRRDVPTREGASPWANRGYRLNTKTFCSEECADAYEVKLALEDMEEHR